MHNYNQAASQQAAQLLQSSKVFVPKKRSVGLFLPLLLLMLLAGFLFRGLWLDPKKIPSALIGHHVPILTVPILSAPHAGVHPSVTFNAKQMLGKPWVLNVFASWCTACLVEHSLWLRFQKAPEELNTLLSKGVDVVGLAYKDKPEQSLAWLSQYGNPYAVVTADMAGQYGIELGVYGVPETFIMNAHNQIVYKHVGPVDEVFFAELAKVVQGSHINNATRQKNS